MTSSKISAGLLMFRKQPNRTLEVLLVHPGGPFFRNKDETAWSIPKGVAASAEDLLSRALIEFEEELGFAPCAETWIDLGTVKQEGGKTVHAWAFAGDLPPDFQLRSNTFELEWPPHSGRLQQFPEVDRAEFFSIAEAKRKINPAQIALVDRLVSALHSDERQES